MINLIVLSTTIQITGGEKRQTGNEKLLKLMTSTVTLTGINGCGHTCISCVTPDKIYFGFRNAINMVDTTTGKILHELATLGSGEEIFIVSSSGELIVLDMYNIIKWSYNMKTKVIKLFKRGMGLSWKPRCLYYYSYTCDLLVGMYERDVDTKTETGITLNKISNRPN